MIDENPFPPGVTISTSTLDIVTIIKKRNKLVEDEEEKKYEDSDLSIKRKRKNLSYLSKYMKEILVRGPEYSSQKNVGAANMQILSATLRQLKHHCMLMSSGNQQTGTKLNKSG